MNAESIPGVPDPASKPQTDVVSASVAKRPVRSRRALWLVLVVLVVGGAVGLWQWMRKPEPITEPPMPTGIREDEIVGALERKRAAVLVNPKSADAWGEYGLVLIAHLFDKDAEFCFDEAIRLNPEDPRWSYVRGHIALRKDQLLGMKLLQKAIATTGTGDDVRKTARLLLAETHLERGELAEAEILFREALGPPPGEPRALYGLGMIAIARGDEATAVRLMTGLLTNESTKKPANVQLARIARLRGDFASADRFEAEAARLPEPVAWPDPMYDLIHTLAVGRRGRERMIFFLEQRRQFLEAAQAYLKELELERSPKALIGAGINFFRLGDHERGTAFMREAVERDPTSPIAAYNLALVLFTRAEKDPESAQSRKWFEETVVYARRTVELKPDHARGWLFWGLSLKHLGDPKGAAEALRKGLIARPEEFELHLGLGQVLAQLGNVLDARTSLENAQRLDPKDPRPAQELEKLRGKPPVPSWIPETEVLEALERKRAKVVANPRLADAWGEYGMILIAHLFDREAELCFAEAARLNPEDPRWPYLRGHVALKKDPPSALGLLRQAIATTGPGDVFRKTARLLLAETQLERGELSEAEALFRAALGPAPGEPRAAFGLGMVAIARGDDATATRLMTGLLGNKHTWKQASVQLARLARARGDRATAERYEAEAAGMPDPTAWPDPMFDVISTLVVGRRGREQRILFLEQNNRFHEAAQLYLKELELERSPKALIGAGINFARLGDYDRATAFVSEAVLRDPKSPIATYNLALVLFTRAEKEVAKNPKSAEAQRWFQETVVHARRTVELKPDHAGGCLLWGLALKHLGDPKGAAEAFRKGLVARPEEFELHLGLGLVLVELGRVTEARSFLENARRINPRDPRPAQELKKLLGEK